MEVEELREKACPYFAQPEELLALEVTINRIRQREIQSTDNDILKASEQFVSDAESEIERAIEARKRTMELKMEKEKRTAKQSGLELVEEKPN